MRQCCPMDLDKLLHRPLSDSGPRDAICWYPRASLCARRTSYMHSSAQRIPALRVCGKNVIVSGLKHHIQKCQAKWQANEDLKPMNEQLPMPEGPMLDHPDDPQIVREYSKKAVVAYQDSMCILCTVCRRRSAVWSKFTPASLLPLPIPQAKTNFTPNPTQFFVDQS